MAKIAIVEGSVPAAVMVALRAAGHTVRAVAGAAAVILALPPEAPDVIVIPDEAATVGALRAVREALPGVRIMAARRADLTERPSGVPDMALPADADPAVWTLALAALDLSRELPDPGLEEARDGLQTVVRSAHQAFDALRTAATNDRSGSESPAGMLDEVGERLERSYQLLLRLTLDRLERRIEGFAGHSGRVADLGRRLAGALEAPVEVREAVNAAGRYHDLGMHLVVSPAALARRGPLGDRELRAVRQHPTASADAVAPLRLSEETLDGIRDHHERLDGSGYPAHKRGSDVSMAARIVAVADSYEALTHARPHRPAMSSVTALDAIDAEGRDGHLDRDVCAALRTVVLMERAG